MNEQANRTTTSTYFALLSEFGSSEIPLADCCEKYFGVSPKMAGEKAAQRALPVPTYRVGSQKSGWLVNAVDLANLIEQKLAEGQEAWACHNRRVA